MSTDNYDPAAPLYDRLMTYIAPDDDTDDHGEIRLLMTEAAQVVHQVTGCSNPSCACGGRAREQQPKEIKNVPAPRPVEDTRWAWRCAISSLLPEGERHDFDRHEFVPCHTCSTKTGSPGLCRGCLANRQTITELREALCTAFDEWQWAVDSDYGSHLPMGDISELAARLGIPWKPTESEASKARRQP